MHVKEGQLKFFDVWLNDIYDIENQMYYSKFVRKDGESLLFLKINLCTLFPIHDLIQKVKQKTKHLWVIHCRAFGSVAIFPYMICFSAENQPSEWKPLQRWLLSLNFEIESDKSAKTRTQSFLCLWISSLSLSLRELSVSRISFWPGLV